MMSSRRGCGTLTVFSDSIDETFLTVVDDFAGKCLHLSVCTSFIVTEFSYIVYAYIFICSLL